MFSTMYLDDQSVYSGMTLLADGLTLLEREDYHVTWMLYNEKDEEVIFNIIG